jgi:hypothetical protein
MASVGRTDGELTRSGDHSSSRLSLHLPEVGRAGWADAVGEAWRYRSSAFPATRGPSSNSEPVRSACGTAVRRTFARDDVPETIAGETVVVRRARGTLATRLPGGRAGRGRAPRPRRPPRRPAGTIDAGRVGCGSAPDQLVAASPPARAPRPSDPAARCHRKSRDPLSMAGQFAAASCRRAGDGYHHLIQRRNGLFAGSWLRALDAPSAQRRPQLVEEEVQAAIDVERSRKSHDLSDFAGGKPVIGSVPSKCCWK